VSGGPGRPVEAGRQAACLIWAVGTTPAACAPLLMTGGLDDVIDSSGWGRSVWMTRCARDRPHARLAAQLFPSWLGFGARQLAGAVTVASAVEGARKGGTLTRKDDQERELVRALAQARSRVNDLLCLGFAASKPTPPLYREQEEAYEDFLRAEEALRIYRQGMPGDDPKYRLLSLLRRGGPSAKRW
jgi:hypothetical protein